jgi:hypothetical protein
VLHPQILIHDVFALVADSVPRRAQYRKFADRLLFTTLPQRVLEPVIYFSNNTNNYVHN